MSGALWTIFVTGTHLMAATAAIVLVLLHAGQKIGERHLLRRANLALGLSALWALAGLLVAGPRLELQFLQGATDLAWLWLLSGLFASDERDKNIALVRPLVHALALVELVQLVICALRLPVWAYGVLPAPVSDALFSLSVMFQLLFSIGALVLVHNLYVGAAQPARHGLRWPAMALALLWLYDLNLYTVAYLAAQVPAGLEEGRALVLLGVVGLLGYGTLGRRTELRFQPSRSFAFRSFSLAVIGAYLVVMVLIAQAISWLRFTRTMGRGGAEEAPLQERAIRAVADMTDSPGGLLLTPTEHGKLGLAARWQWPTADVPAEALPARAVQAFEADGSGGFIIDLDELRGGNGSPQGQWAPPQEAVPQWLLDEPRAWAMVPLLHFDRLVGMVVLARPTVTRRLDWEDFDLLRVAGQQLASYLSEQAGQAALVEAIAVRRFPSPHRLRHARYQEPREPAQPARPQCRAARGEEGIPRRHARHAA